MWDVAALSNTLVFDASVMHTVVHLYNHHQLLEALNK